MIFGNNAGPRPNIMYAVRFQESLSSAESYTDGDLRRTTEVLTGVAVDKLRSTDINPETPIALNSGRVAVAFSYLSSERWQDPEISSRMPLPVAEFSVAPVFFKHPTYGNVTQDTLRLRRSDKARQWSFVYGSSHTTRVIPLRSLGDRFRTKQAIIVATPNSSPSAYSRVHSSGGALGYGGGGSRDEHYLALGEQAVDRLALTLGRTANFNDGNWTLMQRTPEVKLAIDSAFEREPIATITSHN